MTVTVTKCPDDPRLYYNRRWGKTSCSKKGNRTFFNYSHRELGSSFPSNEQEKDVNLDIKKMACYNHGTKIGTKEVSEKVTRIKNLLDSF